MGKFRMITTLANMMMNLMMKKTSQDREKKMERETILCLNLKTPTKKCQLQEIDAVKKWRGS